MGKSQQGREDTSRPAPALNEPILVAACVSPFCVILVAEKDKLKIKTGKIEAGGLRLGQVVSGSSRPVIIMSAPIRLVAASGRVEKETSQNGGRKRVEPSRCLLS